MSERYHNRVIPNDVLESYFHWLAQRKDAPLNNDGLPELFAIATCQLLASKNCPHPTCNNCSAATQSLAWFKAKLVQDCVSPASSNIDQDPLGAHRLVEPVNDSAPQRMVLTVFCRESNLPGQVLLELV